MGGGQVLELVDEQHSARSLRGRPGVRLGQEDFDRAVDLPGEVADERLEVAGTVARLIDVSTNDGAQAVLTGSGDAVTLSANNGARIHAEGFAVTTAAVTADNGARTTVCATGAVTGDVTNGADLVVRCGGTISGVSTSNGGTASTGS